MTDTRRLTIILSFTALAGCAHVTSQAPLATRAPAPPPPTVQPTAAPPPPVAVDSSAEVKAALHGAVVHFDFDSASLKPDGMAALQRVATPLRHFGGHVKIEGNCDERGTEEYNLALGQKRAEVARKYLVDLGVDASKLATVSYGALRPANPAHTADAWTENRRDDLRVAQ